MSTIVLRIPKGAPLTFQEADDNFNNLNEDKYEYGDTFRVATATPASAAATGVVGTICWDASYIYVCVATNTWKRVAISTW